MKTLRLGLLGATVVAALCLAPVAGSVPTAGSRWSAANPVQITSATVNADQSISVTWNVASGALGVVVIVSTSSATDSTGEMQDNSTTISYDNFGLARGGYTGTPGYTTFKTKPLGSAVQKPTTVYLQVILPNPWFGTSQSGLYTCNQDSQYHSDCDSQIVALTISPAAFTVAASPSSQSVIAGGTTQFTLTWTGVGGYVWGGSLTETVTGVPSGTTYSSPGGTGSDVITFVTSSSTPPGSYPLTFTLTDGKTTHTATATLIVAAGTPPPTTTPTTTTTTPTTTTPKPKKSPKPTSTSTSSIGVLASVEGSGHITGGSIHCPGHCTATLTKTHRTVKLTATPAPGYVFSRWGGLCSGFGRGTCTAFVLVVGGDISYWGAGASPGIGGDNNLSTGGSPMKVTAVFVKAP